MTFDTTPVPVPVGKCRCPGEPHGDGDVVYLHREVSMSGGMGIKAALSSQITDSIEAQVILARAYFGEIQSWTFTDEEGDPVPVTPETANRLLPWARGGREVAEKADDLYIADVATPFLAQIRKLTRRPKPSGPGLTPSTATSGTPNGRTSSARPSTRSRRK